jgi:hypothetical protein
MIDDNIIYARIQRNKASFDSAGSYFRIPPHIPKIDVLNGVGIILMLYFDETRWTAISRKALYFKNGNDYDCTPIEIAGLEIHDYLFGNINKCTSFEYIVMKTRKKMWIVNAITCSSIENIILMLENDGKCPTS